MQRVLSIIAAVFLTGGGFASARTLYVAQEDQTPVDPYTNLVMAASNIQDAVEAAVSGDRIMVHEGVYTSGSARVVYIYDKALELHGVDGPGGVIIDGQGTRIGVYALMRNESGDILFDGLTVTNCVGNRTGAGFLMGYENDNDGTMTLENCVITDCRIAAGERADDGGGGLLWFAYQGTGFGTRRLVISNCTFRGNQAIAGTGQPTGGAIHLRGGEGTIVDSRILENYADGGGGGIRVNGATMALHTTLLDGNSAPDPYRGGGIHVAGAASEVLLDRSTLRYNVCGYWGGAVYIDDGSVTLRGCLLYGNEGRYSGGIRQQDGSLQVENCTIVGNQATGTSATGSGGIMVFAGTCAVTNSILYYNRDYTGSNYDNLRGAYVMGYSCLTNPTPPGGAHNIEDLPGFVTAGTDYGTNHVAGNYRLDRDSQCLNGGTNLAWTAAAVDLDGYPRRDTALGIADMGAYEFMYRGTMVTVR